MNAANLNTIEPTFGSEGLTTLKAFIAKRLPVKHRMQSARLLGAGYRAPIMRASRLNPMAVLAQKCVWPGNRVADDGDWQFFIGRIEPRARLRPDHDGRALGAIAFEWRVCRTEQASTLEPACLYSRDKRLARAPFVAMVQTADLWEHENLAGSGWVYRAALRTILVEREMCSRLVVIVKVRRQHTAHVTLVEDDDVIETLAANRANDALDVGVLPR